MLCFRRKVAFYDCFILVPFSPLGVIACGSSRYDTVRPDIPLFFSLIFGNFPGAHIVDVGVYGQFAACICLSLCHAIGLRDLWCVRSSALPLPGLLGLMHLIQEQ
jgi:hypothetical protein